MFEQEVLDEDVTSAAEPGDNRCRAKAVQMEVDTVIGAAQGHTPLLPTLQSCRASRELSLTSIWTLKSRQHSLQGIPQGMSQSLRRPQDQRQKKF